MIIFFASLSFIIAILCAMLHKSKNDGYTDSKFMIFTKTFIISFIVIYFGCMFFYPQGGINIVKTQEIEVGDPDF